MMLAYKNTLALFFLIGLAFFSSCQKPVAVHETSPGVSENNPEWMNEQIVEFKNEKPANPPVKIFQYLYKGRPVYYITSYCCDIPGKVLNAQGEQLCEPDGGITGRGDGKCADFFETRTAEKLIWEDLRK